MSLSISNSKKAILYTVVATAFLLLPAVGLVNSFIDFAESKAGDLFGIQRIRSTVNSLDHVARSSEPTVLMFGSSLVKDGFSPRYFDEKLANDYNVHVDSYNIGLGNMNPAYQLLLAKRLRETFEQEGKKADLAIIEFNPFLTTVKREKFRPFLKEQVTAVLMSDEEIMDISTEDPTLFSRMVITKYLRSGVSAEAITGGIKALIDSAQAQAPLADKIDDEYLAVLEKRKALKAELANVIREARPKTKKSHVWNPKTQGGLIDMMDIPEEHHDLVAELTDNLQYEKTLEWDVQSRVDCCDILNLEFSDNLVADFEKMIEEFSAFSKQVEIVLMPRNNDIVSPSPEALARQEQLINRLSKKYNVTVRNYQTHPAFDSNMFYDATHLSMDSGKITFSKVIADDIGQHLIAQGYQDKSSKDKALQESVALSSPADD